MIAKNKVFRLAKIIKTNDYFSRSFKKFGSYVSNHLDS